MAVTESEFDDWIKKGKEIGATHLISVMDTFNCEDYPVYVMPDEDISETKKQYDNVNMQRINEVVAINAT